MNRADEFYAARKEQHIARMVQGVRSEMQLSGRLAQSEYFAQQVDSLAPEDVPLLWQRLDASLRQSEFGTLLFRRWTELDAHAAAAWATGLPMGEERDALLKQAALVWSAQDLKGAIVWSEGLVVASERQVIGITLAQESVRQDPFTALELAARLNPGTERDRLMLRAINEWAASEPVEALKWTAKIDDPAWQKEVRQSLIPVIASIDGEAGAQLAASWLLGGPDVERTVVAVVQRWAQESPEAAAEWVARFPAGPMRLAALDNLKRLQTIREEGLAQEQVLP